MQISALFYASHAVPACSGLSKFVFRETPVNPDLDFVMENDYVKICAKSKDKILETNISVWRQLNLDEPIN